MIIQTTPEIAEGLYEHLLILKINDFELSVSSHRIINSTTKVYFKLEITENFLKEKLLNLIDLYNQLIPNQKTLIATEEDLKDTQDYWSPLNGLTISFKPGAVIRLKRQIGFGIGLHPSTILALRAIDEISNKNKIIKFVDIGSGSGILSLFCATKNIEEIIAFEIDDKAIQLMKENFYLNNFNPNKINLNPYISQEMRLNDIKDVKTILNSSNSRNFDSEDFSQSLFVANMRPQELNMCRDILRFSKKTIISGFMENEKVPDDIISSKRISFDEWICVY